MLTSKVPSSLYIFTSLTSVPCRMKYKTSGKTIRPKFRPLVIERKKNEDELDVEYRQRLSGELNKLGNKKRKSKNMVAELHGCEETLGKAKDYLQDIEKYIPSDILGRENVTLRSFKEMRQVQLEENPKRKKKSKKEKKIIVDKSKYPSFPISPRLGPFIIENPQVTYKNYFWCSCGQSQKQPVCDRSHKGTNFGPLKFCIEEKVEKIFICGCKLTSQAPFCDGQACLSKDNLNTISVQDVEMNVNSEPTTQDSNTISI